MTGKKDLFLVINAGSSSIKFNLFQNGNAVFGGHIDGIGNDSCLVKYWENRNNKEKKSAVSNIGKKSTIDGKGSSSTGGRNSIGKTLENEDVEKREHIIYQIIKTHSDAINYMLKLMKLKNINTGNIKAIGHRVVHGGTKYEKSIIITKKVIKDIDRLSFLAPLHNPHNLEGIKACIKHIPKAKNVAVFDTSFHSTMPDLEKIYPIPNSLVQKYHIKRYGFHGTSYKYVYSQMKKIDTKARKVIICHLGNGSSICAIKDGKSIATTMGYTPLEGLPMGTRSGTIDPGIIILLSEEEYDINRILNNDSGLKALAGTNDMRLIWENMNRGNKKAEQAISYLSMKIAEYIGSYMTKLNGLDSIVFTGGLGEKAFYVRERVIERLSFIGAKLDKEKNRNNRIKISHPKSKIGIYVIPTNEDYQIYKETKDLIEKR